MAAVGARVSVTSSATSLAQADTAKSFSLLVTNRGGASVDLGGPSVASGSGYQLDPGESVAISSEKFPPGVYAIATSGTVTVHVLQVGD